MPQILWHSRSHCKQPKSFKHISQSLCMKGLGFRTWKHLVNNNTYGDNYEVNCIKKCEAALITTAFWILHTFRCCFVINPLQHPCSNEHYNPKNKNKNQTLSVLCQKHFISFSHQITHQTPILLSQLPGCIPISACLKSSLSFVFCGMWWFVVHTSHNKGHS